MKRFVIVVLFLLPVLALAQASGKMRWGLKYAERKRIWLETMRAHDRADSETTVARGQYRGRNIMGEIAAWGEQSDKLADQYIRDLMQAHHINSLVYDSVIAEGIRYDWPRR